MNRIAHAVILSTALALLPFAAVRSQAPAAGATGVQTLDAQAPAKPAAAKRPARSHADARACLDLATNFEIIACAEKYR